MTDMDINLEHYGITAERGFLTPYLMDEVSLPLECEGLVQAALGLKGGLVSGQVRQYLSDVPLLDMAALLPDLDEAQRRLLMVRFSFIVQAWVWGEQVPSSVLPRHLAVPYCLLADALDMFPLLPYSAYTLDNWRLLDKSGPVALENIAVIQNFLGGQDEDWFILVHVKIEAKAGRALAAVPALLQAVKAKDADVVQARLQEISKAWDGINATFDRMPEKCDPYIYFHRVRPYIHGWKDNPALPNGVVYEGVEKYKGQPQVFRGQTGSQSSIVPLMDALLGISHDTDPLRAYLDELHGYRPVGHRRFIEDVQNCNILRPFILNTKNNLCTELYNKIVSSVHQFRARHLEYAASYIHKQTRGFQETETVNSTDVGTGGTPFMKYLKKHRDESGAHLIQVGS